MINAYKMWSKYLEGRNHVEDIGTERMAVLKRPQN
jgi:hypothetical protein